MDDDICRWIIEFLLRSSMDDLLLKRILAVIPLPDKDFRLKKTVLLRAIESEISEADVTENSLKIFEMIEQLDKTEGLATMESMKAAYCATAVECTVKYLAVGGIDKHGRYFDAVRRIWRGRVMEMERSGKSELVSRELKGWKDELEAAVRDKNVWKKLESMNTRYEALKLMGDFLREAWGVLGPSFLQLSAYLMEKGMTDEMHTVQLEQAIDKTTIVSEDVGARIELPSQTANYSRPELQGSVPVLSLAETKRNDLLNMNQDSGVNDGSNRLAFAAVNTERVQGLATETAEGQESAFVAMDTVRVQELATETAEGQESAFVAMNTVRVQELVTETAEGQESAFVAMNTARIQELATETAEGQESAFVAMNTSRARELATGTAEGQESAFVAMNIERVQELATETAEGQESVEKEVVISDDPSPSRRENLKPSVLPRCKSLASHRRVRGGAKISHLEDLEDDSSSDKFSRLHTPEFERVREALKTSSLELQALVKDPLPEALRIAESVAHDLAEKNKTREHSLEDQNDAGPANPVINKDAMPLRSVRADLKNPCHGHQTIVPQPSIMERNSTACTYEWNDSIDDSPEHNHRLHLPSPKRKIISPLKKYEEAKIVRRRKCNRWSVLEEDTLRTGVQRFGKGNWKHILNSYRDIFDDRKEVDLKDKWRNMSRYC